MNLDDPALISKFYEHNKISPEDLNLEDPPSNHYYILKSHGQKQLPSSKESASLAKQNSDQHAKNIAKLMVDYKMISSSEFDAAVKTIQGKPEKYRYSKWLVLQLLIKMRDMNKKIADQITQDMYLYASSQASFSAPYLKLE